MATRQWSLTDHVSVENGSPTVTAEAAVWLVTAKPGNGISFDGGSKYYEILTVDSNTQITLADNFAETTISDGSVLIDNRGNGYTPAEVEVVQLYKDIALNQIDLFQTTGKPPDTRGGDGSIGWDGPNRVWYQKTNGAWGDPQNLGGADGMDAGFKFKIDKSSISMADPGSGKFRLNNAAAASVTAIAFDDISADFGSPDVSAYLATWAQSTNTVKGHLIFHEVGATQNFLVYAITSLVDNTGWTQVNVSHVASGGSFDDGDELAIAFIRAGDKGDPGVQAGFRFKFATMTGMVDPGTGFLRFNSNTYASITAVAISDLCAATGNPNVSASILSWDNSGNTENKGVLRISKQDAEQTFIELAIVGATTDDDGWSQLDVEYLSGNGTFATNDQIVVAFNRTGDDGWSPLLGAAEDGERRVFQVTDWIGGVGTKPAVGGYLGSSGLVEDIEDAVDVRGPVGLQGQGLEPDAKGVFADRTGYDDEDAAFVFFSADGNGAEITSPSSFVKLSSTSGDWSAAIPLQQTSGEAVFEIEDIASASTCDIGSTSSEYVNITGTTTISSFGMVANKKRRVRFEGALTLTYNASTLILPGNANLKTAAGDEAEFASDESGSWKCTNYQRATALAVVKVPSFSASKSADQTGIASATLTQITFNTEDFDEGNHFSSSAWTPPAGLIMMTASLNLGGTVSVGNLAAVAIYKNGTAFRRTNVPALGGANQQAFPSIAVLDRASGTDVYTVYGLLTTNSGTVTASAAIGTFFQGAWLAP